MTDAITPAITPEKIRECYLASSIGWFLFHGKRKRRRSMEIKGEITMIRKVNADGNIFYYNEDGLLHREDGPARIYRSGSEFWYKNGVAHREDGPSSIYSSGSEEWKLNDMLDRKDGPAWIHGHDIRWYRNGKIHREDGPAWLLGDKKYWYLNGIEQRTP
jgi:antitoxin component YwqK of YwqJK toxin-antitoxin module